MQTDKSVKDIYDWWVGDSDSASLIKGFFKAVLGAVVLGVAREVITAVLDDYFLDEEDVNFDLS